MKQEYYFLEALAYNETTQEQEATDIIFLGTSEIIPHIWETSQDYPLISKKELVYGYGDTSESIVDLNEEAIIVLLNGINRAVNLALKGYFIYFSTQCGRIPFAKKRSVPEEFIAMSTPKPKKPRKPRLKKEPETTSVPPPPPPPPTAPQQPTTAPQQPTTAPTTAAFDTTRWAKYQRWFNKGKPKEDVFDPNAEYDREGNKFFIIYLMLQTKKLLFDHPSWRTCVGI